MPVTLLRRRRKGASGGSARTVRRAVLETLADASVEGRVVAVLLTDDAEIRGLNAGFRGFDKPTDVLAFALDEADDAAPSPKGGQEQGGQGELGGEGELGDIVISVERARAQATSRRVTLDSELELLAVHGALHLLGYDHDVPARAKRMRAKTRAIRARLRRGRSR
ncbi:MAG: rRNA maturation RNase YbeY [Deltaproteobacteria bacterium]|nr:rRNA maturation RNase YbeY [Deltaproteobacteria bacterium]